MIALLLIAVSALFVGHSSQSTRMASGSFDNTIKVWNVDNGTCEKTLKGHQASVTVLAQVGLNQLASGAGDKSIKIWDLESGACVKTLTGHSDYIRALALISTGILARLDIFVALFIFFPKINSLFIYNMIRN